MNNFIFLIKVFLRLIPFRFIGEIMILGLVVLVFNRHISEDKTLDWRMFYQDRQNQVKIDPNIVVIKIDDLAIRSVSGGSVNRDYIADLVNELKSYSPKVIGLDFLLTTRYNNKIDHVISEIRKSDPEYMDPDENLRNSLQGNIPVVLAAELVKNDKNKIQVIKPIEELLMDNVRFGYTGITIDRDRICRRIGLYKRISGEELPAYSTQVCLSTGFDLKPDYTNRTIHFRSPNKAFASFSSKDILEGKFRQVSDDWFKNKIILVGVTYSGSDDFFKTPVNGLFRNESDYPGIFIHAMIVNNILENAFVNPPVRFYNYLILLLAICITIAGILKNEKSISLLLLTGIGILHIVLCFWFFMNNKTLSFLLPLVLICVSAITIAAGIKLKYEYRKKLKETSNTE